MRPLVDTARVATTLALASCFSSTLPEYEEARARALVTPPAVAADWKPDAALLLSPRAMSTLTAAVLAEHGTLSSPVTIAGIGRVIPDLKIVSASIEPSKACPSCLAIDVALDGTVRTEGVLTTSSPLAGTVGIDVEIEGRSDGRDHVITLRPRDVRALKINKTGLPDAVGRALSAPLTAELKRALGERRDPYTIARLPASSLPIRAVRAVADGQAVRVDIRTAANATSDLALGNTPPRMGWLFAIEQDSLLAIARAEAMRAGPVSYDVVPEPTGLRMTGDRFELDLRLWKTTGAGWWRDYTVHGTIARSDKGVELTPGEIDARGASEGAAAADPLAALGGSVILSTIRESMEVSMPAVHQADVGAKRKVRLDVSSVRGAGSMVQISGTLEAGEPPPPTRSGRR